MNQKKTLTKSQADLLNSAEMWWGRKGGMEQGGILKISHLQLWSSLLESKSSFQNSSLTSYVFLLCPINVWTQWRDASRAHLDCLFRDHVSEFYVHGSWNMILKRHLRPNLTAFWGFFEIKYWNIYWSEIYVTILFIPTFSTDTSYTCTFL